MLYKLPNEHNANPLIKNGVGYMFITSNDAKIEWKLSNISINSSQSIPGLTLQPYYKVRTYTKIILGINIKQSKNNINISE